MKKIIIFLGIVTIIIGLSTIIVRAIIGEQDEKVESEVKYIVVNPPLIATGLQEMNEKTEYPEMDYIFLGDTGLTFYMDDKTYVERTGEFQFFVDQECKIPLSVNPVFISSEIILCGESYAVLAEENRVLFFPVGEKIPHLISR